MKKIVIVVGARPQFIKLLPLVEALSNKVKIVLVHTGQHYDFEMSEIFFDQLGLPQPDFHLGVGSGTPAGQTGAIMARFEEVIRDQKPDMVVVTGDTNSTLAGALTAAQNSIPLTHVEAGLRSQNKWLPEQISRVVTDRLSDILCCPTATSIGNLKSEGISAGVYFTGDILYDLIAKFDPSPETLSQTLARFGFQDGQFIFMTLHRAENVDDPQFLQSLVKGLKRFPQKIFFPVHPRTQKNLERIGLFEGLSSISPVIVSKPIGIVESLALTKSCLGVITDSGGLQREAVYFGKKVYLLRDETEWTELAECGAVECLGRSLDKAEIVWSKYPRPQGDYFKPAASNIAGAILENL